MPAFLIDTNVLSEMSRSQPDHGVLAFMAEEPDLWLSAITIHEIDYGIARATDQTRRKALEAWRGKMVSSFGSRIIPVDVAIASLAGTMRGRSANENRTRDPLDMLIAATALDRRLVLVSRNIRHFEGFGLPLLNPFSR
jgi:toxin FitB